MRTKIVTRYVSDYREKIARPISDWFAWMCLEYGIDHIDLAQAIFNIGAAIHGKFDMIRDENEKSAHCVRYCPMHPMCVQYVANDVTQNVRKKAKTKIAEYRRLIDRLDIKSSKYATKVAEYEAKINALVTEEMTLTKNRGSMQWDTVTPRDPEKVAWDARKLLANTGFSQAVITDLVEDEGEARRESYRLIRDTKVARIRVVTEHPGPVLGRAERQVRRDLDADLQNLLFTEEDT